jgi:hypothetical protein
MSGHKNEWSVLEQWTNIKFCVKLEQNESDACAILSRDYGGEAVKKSCVFEWHKRFKEGRKIVEDEESSGRPRCNRTDENVEKVQNLVHWVRRLSITAMTVQLNLDK